MLSASENTEAEKRSTLRATHKSIAQQHIQRFCSRQCSRQKNDVLRINPLTGKGFMCFVARVARFLKNIYITFLFQSTLNTNPLPINTFIQFTHSIIVIQSKTLINQCFQVFLFFTCIYLKKMCYICYKQINLLSPNTFHVASTFFYMLHFFVKFAKSLTQQRISCSTFRATFLLHFCYISQKILEKQNVIAHFLYYHSVLHS